MSASERRDEVRAHFEATRAHLEATNAKIEAKAGRNLFFAISSALVFGAVFIASLLWMTEIFVVLVAVLVSIALLELATAFRAANRRVPRVGVILGGFIVIAGAFFYGAQGMLGGLSIAAAILILWRLTEGMLPNQDTPPRTVIRDLFSGVFSLVYVAFLASFAVLLVSADNGQWWVFSLIFIVVAVDVGAYAAGVTLGKHKMTPKISPNKTWEGFAGAAIVATIAGIVSAVFMLHQPWWIGILLGLAVLCTATIGDLTESLMKRNLGVKDMSSWMPGHGGFLDRLDSILPSTVVVYGIALALGAA